MRASPHPGSARGGGGRAGRAFIWVVLFVAVVAVLAYVALRMTRPPQAETLQPAAATVTEEVSSVVATAPAPVPPTVEGPRPAAVAEPESALSASPSEAAAPAPGIPGLAEPTPESRQLITDLVKLPSAEGPWTAEQVAQWKQNLQSLVQQGPAGVAAIREFLQKNQDLDFGLGGWDVLGYPSARAALFDALTQIGGAEAVAVGLETLQNTADPREVALLAKSLETQAPEQHRAEILAAARESLAMAAQGQLTGRDVGPLFEVFEQYGGADVLGDLEQAAKQWKYYATAALGQLPDGAGVPTLIRMVNESNSPNIPALETLASLSVSNPEARDALLAQVAANRISPNIWPYLSQALTGDEVQVADSVFDRVLSRATGRELKTTHINFGNQNFYRMPTIDTLTPDQISQQVALVDQFLEVAGSNPAAVQSLQQARAVLERRLTQAEASAGAATPPPGE